MASTSLTFNILAHDKASKVFAGVGNNVGKTSSAFGKFKVAAVAAAGAAGIGLYQIGGLIKSSIELEASFSKTMAQVATATKAPQTELAKLDKLALDLGKSTVFSANEAAGAMLSLAKGGLSPAQIQAGALQNTLTLATAGELDLASAADSVVQSMGAFGLTAKDTGAAVAALAGAANASSANVSDITQALSQAGTEAHSAGQIGRAHV